MTSKELDAETKRVYIDAGAADRGTTPARDAWEFQKHLMLWVKVLGAERTKECLSHAVDVFAAAVAKVQS